MVVAKGFVILLLVAGTDGDMLDESALVDDMNDLDSFLDPNFFKLKGILYFEDVLVCELNVGAGEIAILCVW